MKESMTADGLFVVRGPSNQFISSMCGAQSIPRDLCWQHSNNKDITAVLCLCFQPIKSQFQ